MSTELPTTCTPSNSSVLVQVDNELEVIDVDSFEFEDSTLQRSKASVNICKGYALIFPDGQSPHGSYPFSLHCHLELPWDYAVRNGQMTLFARGCPGLLKNDGIDSCPMCQNLFKNKMLEGVIKKVLEDMPTGEREEINAKVERYKIGGLPPEIQSQ